MFHPITAGDTLRIWELKEQGSANTDGFQPTDPSGLIIPNQSGHPQLSWNRSEPKASARHYIYRNGNCITSSALSNPAFVDSDVVITQGLSQSYKVRSVSGDGTKLSANYSNVVTVMGAMQKHGTITASQTVAAVELDNYPNPFNPQTTIKYFVRDAVKVMLTVTDIIGRDVAELVDEERARGVYEVRFDGSHLASGLYFCRLRAGTEVAVKRMFLLR